MLGSQYLIRASLPTAFFVFVFVSTSAFAASYVQQGSKLVGTGAVGAAAQGLTVALSADGNTLIEAAENDNGNIGAAWVFTRSNGVWSQQGPKLVASDGVGTPMLGTVALSADGNTAIIGGGYDNSGLGAAFVFTRSNGVWTQQGPKLVVSGNTGSPGVNSVALSADGNTALIGGQADSGAVGAVWVFVRSNGVWTQQGSKLVGSGYTGGPAEGHSVALSGNGNVALIGGVYDNAQIGAFWIFTRSGGVWTQQGSKMIGSGAVGNARQGGSVSLSNDGTIALIGGYADNANLGAAWVFVNSGGTWTQQGNKLVGTGNIGSSKEGSGVSLSGDGSNALLSGPDDNGGIGAGWVFSNSGGTWPQLGASFFGSDYNGAPGQGSTAISVDGSTVALGGTGDSANTGAVWVFTRPLTITSGPSAVPATAGVGQTVNLSATAAGSGGTLSYAWNFGDGSAAATGASVSHAYTTHGVYTVTLNVTDPVNGTLSATVSVTVLDPLVGTGIDSDGDGFSDSFETAVGTLPNDATSTPTGMPATVGGVQTLIIAKASIKLNFAKPNTSDSISFTGTVAVPAGFTATGAKTYFIAGGVIKTLTLTSKGSGVNGKDFIKISLKAKKGVVVVSPAAKYGVAFKNGAFAATLANAGLTNSDAKAVTVMVPFTFIFNNVVFQKTQTMSYTAKKGKTGGAK